MSSSSHKITSKNLSYDQTLPPFLAALRARHHADPSSSGGPDPILAARKRPAGRPRSGSEDAPLVLDGDGNAVAGISIGADGSVLQQQQQQEREPRGSVAGDDDDGVGVGAPDERSPGGRDDAAAAAAAAAVAGKTASIGAGKKRKIGRVIGGGGGGGEDADVDAAAETQAEGGPRARRSDGKATRDSKDECEGVGKAAKAKKKMAKKIKLSFGDADAD